MGGRGRCQRGASYCDCRYHQNRRSQAQREISNDLSSFEGEPAVVAEGNTGRADRLDVYYGGEGSPDGPGHGHVVSNDGENVHYWRGPGDDTPSIDDRA